MTNTIIKLIVLTGFPCSGKSYRAQQLIDDFSVRTAASTARSKTVVHIPSQHALSDGEPDTHHGLRDQIYNSAAAEKNARAAEFSAIKRALSKDAVVIADGLNYIKGYRYQLWCEAKAAGTRCCVVHAAAREDECKDWNRERLRKQKDETGGDGLGEGDEQEQQTTKPNGFGDLVPESHTAVYGDRGAHEPRSRGSSIDAQLEDQPPEPSLQSFSLRQVDLEAPSLASLSLVNHSQHATDSHGPNPILPLQHDPQTSLPPVPPANTHPAYSPTTLSSLILRYEPPSPFSRWDTPLFTLPTTDPHPPYTAIWTSLFPTPTKLTTSQSRNHNPSTPSSASSPSATVKPHAATVLPTSTPSSALQTLEATTALVSTALLAAYRAANIGDDGGAVTLSIPDPDSDAPISLNVEIAPATVLTQPMLQRLRRKYTQMQRGGLAHGQGYVGGGRRGVAEGFGRFLEGELGG